MENNVVFSKVRNEYVPIIIKKKVHEERACIGMSFRPEIIEYDVYDGRKMVGYVTVNDINNGCYIGYIKNDKPEKYGKFGLLADRLEVQHCLNNEMIDFEIHGYASMNSHALHYLRGFRFNGEATTTQIEMFRKRFKWAKLKSLDLNTLVKYIIDHTPKGKPFNTIFLGDIPMYMPKELIQKYIQELRKNPLIFVH